jgi:hypothetical protein
MRKLSTRQPAARVGVEELEQRCLLSGLATNFPSAPGAGLSGTAPAVSGGLPGMSIIAQSSTKFNASNFNSSSTKITNPLMPLTPGTTFLYTGVKDGQPQQDVIIVTNQTQKIFGVNTVVVHDTVYMNGKVVEKTTDFFAQDVLGNVWYFGESTREAGSGTAGSWMAGVNGAFPGIVMEAHPQIGDSYQQEFAPGVAQDMASVQSLNATFAVPFGTFNNCLQTQETSPLEPGFVEQKYYAAGVGFLGSVVTQGGSETLSLVSVFHH